METEQIQKYTDMLMALPTSIRTKQESILRNVEVTLDLQQEIGLIEGAIKTEVANEEDPNGKKSFTNAETRGLEFNKRCSENQEHITLNEQYKSTNRTTQLLRHDVEMEQNTQRNLRAVLGIFSPAVY